MKRMRKFTDLLLAAILIILAAGLVLVIVLPRRESLFHADSSSPEQIFEHPQTLNDCPLPASLGG